MHKFWEEFTHFPSFHRCIREHKTTRNTSSVSMGLIVYYDLVCVGSGVMEFGVIQAVV